MRFAALAFLAAALVAAPASAAGPPAPALSGVDALTGKRVSLADYRGRAVVVNVWASWCGGCKEEARDLAFFAREHPSVALLGLDTEDSKAGARAFYRRYGFSHPSIFDPKGTLAERLGIAGIPTTLFLDSRHRIVANVTGSATLAQLEAGLRQARGG